jgi:hypothetical protein
MDRTLESELETELEAEFESSNEFETELEQELEGEQEFETELENESGEQFLGSVVSGLGSLLGGSGESQELELETELENEFESEFENELEFEQGEQFFKKLIRRAAPLLRRVAKIAAPLVSKAVAGILPGPFGALAGQGIKGLAGLLREQESELELEQEFEQEQELGEHEVSNELGEHELMAEAMATYAAQASQELEAEALTGAATTLTLSPADRRALRRLVPHLVRGASVLTRVLRMSRTTRPWVRIVPTVVRRTARTLRRNAALGQPITRAAAANMMARQTRRVLTSPRYCAAALRRNVRATRLTARPTVPTRRARAM